MDNQQALLHLDLLCHDHSQCPPLTLLQWYFSRLQYPVGLGTIPCRSDVIVVGTKLESGVISQLDSGLIDDNGKIRTKKQAHATSQQREHEKIKSRSSKINSNSAIMTTKTAIDILYPSYRIVFCLDGSKSSLTVTEDGSIPFNTICDALLIAISDLVSNFSDKSSMPYLKSLFISVVAHRPESDETSFVWQGEVNASTESSLLLKILRGRLDCLRDAAFKSASASASVSSSIPPPLSTTPTLTPSSSSISSNPASSSMSMLSSGSSVESFLKAIIYFLNLLPLHACPRAILLTSGAMNIPSLSSAQTLLSKNKVSLNVLLEDLSQLRPVGFLADINGLRTLAETSGGSLIPITEILHQNCRSKGVSSSSPRESIQKNILTLKWPFLNSCQNLHPRRVDKNMDEKQLQSYQIEGATVEHIIALRYSEGFHIKSVSIDNHDVGESVTTSSSSTFSSSLNSSTRYSSFSSTSSSYRHNLDHVTICMEKYFTNVSKIFYEMTFVRRPRELHSTASMAWTMGTLSIDIRKIGPRHLAEFNTANRGFKEDKLSLNLKTLSGIVQSIVESDKIVTKVLNILFSPSSSPEINNGNNVKATLATNSNFQRSLVNHITSFSDVLENQVLKLESIFSAHYYIRETNEAAVLPIFTSFESWCRDGGSCDLIKTWSEQLLSPRAIIHELSATKWLIITNGNTSSNDAGILLVDAKETTKSLLDLQIFKLSRHVGQFGTLVRQIARTFLAQINGTGVGRGVGGSSSTMNTLPSPLTGILIKAHLSLYSLVQPVYLRRMARTVLQGARAKSETESISSSSGNGVGRTKLFEELLRAKRSIGFHLVSVDFGNDIESSISLSSSGNSNFGLMTAYLNGVTQLNPSGISGFESLLQIKIDCSSDSASVEYYWLQNCNDVLYEKTCGILSQNGEAANEAIETFISSLIDQDKEIFHFYDVIFPFLSTILPPLSSSTWVGGPIPMQAQSSVKHRITTAEFNLILCRREAQKDVILPGFTTEDELLHGHILHLLFTSLSEYADTKSVLLYPSSNDTQMAGKLFCIFSSNTGDRLLILQPQYEILRDALPREGRQLVLHLDFLPIPTEKFGTQQLFENAANVLMIPRLQLSSETTIPKSVPPEFSNTIESGTNLSSETAASHSADDDEMDVDFMTFRNRIITAHSKNYARVVHMAIEQNNESLSPLDVSLGLESCIHNFAEVDISVLCKKRGSINIAQSAASIQKSFMATLGKYLKLDSQSNVFTVTHHDMANHSNDEPKSVASPPIIFQPLENVAFVRFNIIHKGIDENISQTKVPCRIVNLAEIITSFSISLDSEVDIILQMDFMYINETNSTTPELQLPQHLPSSFSIVKKSLQEFVAVETMNTLLTSAGNLTAENLILVQNCLQEVSDVSRFQSSLLFVNPLSGFMKRQSPVYSQGHQVSNFDKVATTYEHELRSMLPNLTKVGDVLYTRSWSMVDSDSGESFTIPCWVILSLSYGGGVANSTSSDAQGNSVTNPSNPSSSSITSTLKVNVIFRKARDISFDVDDQNLHKSILNFLEKCCFKLNQRTLLRDMYETRLASPFLIAPISTNTATNASSSRGNSNIALSEGADVLPSGSNRTGQSTPTTTSSTTNVTKTQSTSTTTSNSASKSGNKHFGVASSIPARIRTPLQKSNDDVDLQKRGLSQHLYSPFLGTLFEPGFFHCERQSEIICSIHAGAALPQEAAIRHLETSALSQLMITNHERFFVYQDTQGNIFYMTFEANTVFSSERERENKSVRLCVFGITPVDPTMRNHLQNLLDHRLIEITAKTISSVAIRNASLPISYMTFLRQIGGTSRHVHVSFSLPNYVHDTLLFCIITRQVFMWTQVIGKVGVAGLPQNEKRVTSPSETLHPASFGYNLHSDATLMGGIKSKSAMSGGGKTNDKVDSSGAENKRDGSSFSKHPLLVRKGHVEEELSDPRLIHPTFFGKKRNLQKKIESRYDEARVMWQQKDFTFLYNAIGPLPPHATQLQKSTQKNIGQGLALIEISPLPCHHSPHSPSAPQILLTGSQIALESDLQELSKAFYSEDLICVSRLTDQQAESSQDTQQIQLRIYPTIAMQTAALVDFCQACLDQALGIYCTERIFVGCGGGCSYSDELNGEDATSSTINSIFHKSRHHMETVPLTSLYPSMKFSDFLRFYHDALKLIKPNSILPSSCGILHIPFTLPKHEARELQMTVLKSILSEVPLMGRHLIVSECDILFSDSRTQRDRVSGNSYPISGSIQGNAANSVNKSPNLPQTQTHPQNSPLQWVDFKMDRESRRFTTAIFGESVQRDVAEVPTSANGVRLLSESDGILSATIPLWLRRRTFSLELAVSTTGMYLFFANVNPTFVTNVFTTSSKLVAATNGRRLHSLRTNILDLGIELPVPRCSSHFNDVSTPSTSQAKTIYKDTTISIPTLAQDNEMVLKTLHWGRRAMSKLYLNFSEGNNEEACLQYIPCETWRRGFVAQASCIPLVYTDYFPDEEKGTNKGNKEEGKRDGSICKEWDENGLQSLITSLTNFSRRKGCEVIGKSTDNEIFIIYFVPQTTILNITQLSIGGKLKVANIVHRVVNIWDILSPAEKFASATQDSNIPNPTKRKEVNAMTFFSPKDISLVADNSLVKIWRNEILTEVVLQNLTQMTMNAYNIRGGNRACNNNNRYFSFIHTLRQLSSTLNDNIVIHEMILPFNEEESAWKGMGNDIFVVTFNDIVRSIKCMKGNQQRLVNTGKVAPSSYMSTSNSGSSEVGALLSYSVDEEFKDLEDSCGGLILANFTCECETDMIATAFLFEENQCSKHVGDENELNDSTRSSKIECKTKRDLKLMIVITSKPSRLQESPSFPPTICLEQKGYSSMSWGNISLDLLKTNISNYFMSFIEDFRAIMISRRMWKNCFRLDTCDDFIDSPSRSKILQSPLFTMAKSPRCRRLINFNNLLKDIHLTFRNQHFFERFKSLFFDIFGSRCFHIIAEDMNVSQDLSLIQHLRLLFLQGCMGKDSLACCSSARCLFVCSNKAMTAQEENNSIYCKVCEKEYECDCCKDDDKLVAVAIRVCHEHAVECWLVNNKLACNDEERESLSQEVLEALLYGLQLALGH